MRILVTGATGYVGGRLIPRLLEAGHEVACLLRPGTVLDRPFAGEVEPMTGSADDRAAVAQAAAGCDVAYYLVHSLGDGDFEQRDRELAEGFRQGCDDAGVGRIVYLGGLGDERDELSPHLRSRHEVGRTLAAGAAQVTELRAAVIIGSGSASFEMLRWLTEVLPVMVTPIWVSRTRCQPTAVRDVLEALVAAGERQFDEPHTVLELGGPDVVTYRDMMQIYAREAGLRKRTIIGVPVLSPGLSSRWVSVVTPLPGALAKQLVGSLVNDVVVTGRSAVDEFDLDPMPFDEAVGMAITMVKDLVIPTNWAGAEALEATPDPDDAEWASGKVFEDVRTAETRTATPADLYRAVTGVGGERGWAFGWMWSIRGLLDKLVGGAGMRRGRRHPDDLRVYDALDFWRVTELEPNEFVRLRAEMRLPGHAWLEWRIEPLGDGTTRLTQSARYVPRGLFGRLYWWSLVPFHQVVFPSMLRRIVDRAETIGSAAESAVSTVDDGTDDPEVPIVT